MAGDHPHHHPSPADQAETSTVIETSPAAEPVPDEAPDDPLERLAAIAETHADGPPHG